MAHFLNSQRAFIGSLAAAIALVSFLHFWRIGSIPSGFYVDECAVAYNSYCIATTGADENGTRFPVFIRSLGNFYNDPVIVYFPIPLIKAFGMKDWVARFPSAFFDVAASLIFAFLVQEYCRNRWISLLGGLVFSVIPWVFPMSRTISGGYTAMLFGMATGWLCLLRALRKRSHGYAVVSGLAWALAMYSYPAGRPMTVLLLASFALAFNRSLLSRWRFGLTVVATWLLTVIPIVVAARHSPEALTTRFETTSIFRDHPTPLVALVRFAGRFGEYFSPRFLLLTGDGNLRHHTRFGGELFWFLVPLILAGVYCVLRFSRGRPCYRFLGLGTLVYPTVAALTMDHMHAPRCINGAIFWVLLAAVGTRLLWQQRRLGRKLLVVIGCAGLVEISLYLQDYFGPYQVRSRNEFQAPLAEALKYCFQHLSKDQVLYISRSTYTPEGWTVNEQLKPSLYEHVLFYGNIDPRTYQRAGFPTDQVQLYQGTTPRSGLLLRCDHFLVRRQADFRVLVYPNYELLPDGARLAYSTTFASTPIRYEVFTVP